jgi:hypothetical protein
MDSLPKSANKHFRMVDYVTHSGKGHEHPIPAKPKVSDLHSCGTAACALGWAMTVPAFRRAGLVMEFDFGGQAYVENSHEVFGIDSDFFGLDEWDLLFGPNNKDRTPKEWAKRVRKLLKMWEREAAVQHD